MITERRKRRFWAMVDQSAADSCWPWKGKVETTGYARTLTGSKVDRRHWLCHRLAWTIVNGDIPDGLLVCHRCDFPRCCNPAHLFLGTYAENRADSVKKGRHAHGERNGSAKLSTLDIWVIRSLLKEGFTQTEIGSEYGIGQTTVSQIHRDKIWKHVHVRAPGVAPGIAP